MDIVSTRLRFAAAADPEMVSRAISALPFKVEIKGGPVLGQNGKWYVWFIIPDNVPELINLEMP